MLAGEMRFGVHNLGEGVTDRIQTLLGRRLRGCLDVQPQKSRMGIQTQGRPKGIILPE